MAMSGTAIEQKPLTLAAQAASHICTLPAVGTQDWCQRAAAALLPIRSEGIVSVSLMVLGPRGHARQVEACGMAGADCDNHPDAGDPMAGPADESLGWWFDDPVEAWSVRAECLKTLPCALSWPLSLRGQWWAARQVTDLAVGCGGMVGDEGRCLIVELGVDRSHQPIEDWELSVLRTMLPHLVRRAVMAFGSMTSTANSRLTSREQQVLEQLTLGKSVRQIADHLSRSPHTVHDHVKSLHRKLNASSRGELVARALGHMSAAREVMHSCPPSAAKIGVTVPTPALLSA